MKLDRAFFIPEGSTKVSHKNSSAVAYLYQSGGRPCAKMFSGKRSKPDQAFYYQDERRREKSVENFFANIQMAEENVRNRRAKASAPHGLQVGDIMVSIWGYSMTLVDFYRVVEITPKGATLEEIGSTLVSGDAGYQGTVVADPKALTGKTHKIRIRGDNSGKIDNHGVSPWDGKPCFFNRMD